MNHFAKYKLIYEHLWQTYGSAWQVRLSFVLRLIGSVIKLTALPIALSLVIARLSLGDYPGTWRAVVAYCLGSATLGLLIPLIRLMSIRAENNAYRIAAKEYFEKLVDSDLGFFNSNMSGYLTTATRQYLDSSMELLRNIRDNYMPSILSIALPLVVITFIDIWLGLITMGLSLVQAMYLLYSSRLVDPYRRRSREIYRKNSGRMSDIISNIITVKSSAQESVFLSQVEQNLILENEIFRQRFFFQIKLIAIREVLTVIFFIILLSLTVYRLSIGAIDIAGAVLVITYTTTILAGIYSLSGNLDQHDDYIDKILPAFDILNRQNHITDPSNPVNFGDIKGDIVFDNVLFSYKDQEPNTKVLESFSLTIPHGQKVGVVGLSGAGKSTLAKLLMRFDDVDAGAISIDGINIKSVKQTDLRSKISYVPQEPLLFHASVKDNVLLSRPESTNEEIVQALKQAHAWDFVKQLSKGVDSIVGERGVKLSGGQKQRIAIARAVLRDSSIIILDEATSALDSESEQIIKNSFAQVLHGKTAIIVAHRLSTLSEMDRIIVISEGKLTEDGTHDSLLEQNGVYAKLWRSQQSNLETD